MAQSFFEVILSWIYSRTLIRGGSRAATTSKMERFVIAVNGFQPLTIITKLFILDVAAALDPPLLISNIAVNDLFLCIESLIYCDDNTISTFSKDQDCLIHTLIEVTENANHIIL